MPVITDKNEIIEPFNIIYTHDCFMNALLCAAKYYVLDYSILTLHRYSFYSFEGEQLILKNVTLFSIEDLCNIIGLKICRKKDYFKKWKQEYKTDFKCGNLIIAPHDDYYNPLRVDTYNKIHVPHYTLIHDMDCKKSTLSVIESKYRTTVFYKNMKMRCEDYEKSHFQKEMVYRYVLSKNKSNLEVKYKEKYIYLCQGLIGHSISNLHNYIYYLSQNDYIDNKEWLENLNNICNQVKVECYIFENVINNKELTNISTKILNSWYLVRRYVVKLLMIGPSTMVKAKIMDELRMIEELEKNKETQLYICRFTT